MSRILNGRSSIVAFMLLFATICQADAPARDPTELLQEVKASEPFVMERDAPQVAPTTKPGHWVTLGNLANAVGVKPFSKVYIPVRVNIFPIGLDGSGNLGVKLPVDLAREWLEHLDQIIPHSTVSTQDPDPEHDPGTDLSKIPADFEHALDDDRNISHAAQVLYKYSYHLIETHPKVLQVIEKVMHANHRLIHAERVDLSSNNGQYSANAQYQIDPEVVAATLEELANHLNMDSTGYNIFILNPKASWPFAINSKPTDFHFRQQQSKYGYRTGLSNLEIDAVLRHEHASRAAGNGSSILIHNQDPVDSVRERNPIDDEAKIAMEDAAGESQEAQVERLTRSKLLSDDDVAPTAAQQLEDLKNHEDGIKDEVRAAKKKAGEASSEHLDSLYDDLTKDRLDTDQDEVLKKPQTEKFVTESLHWAEEKLSGELKDARGPMTVDKYIEQLQTSELGSRYMTWFTKNQYAQEECLLDTWVSSSRTAFVDLTAGPFWWGPVVGGEGVRTAKSLPHVDTFASVHQDEEYTSRHGGKRQKEAEPAQEEEDGMHDAAYNWDTIKAERIVYSDFLRDNCDAHADPKTYTDNCKDMYEKLQELEQFILAHKKDHKEDDSSFADHNAFSFFNDGFSSGHHYNIEADHFLSHMSAVLSHSLHHVFTPSTSEFFATYADRVTFNVYILSNHHQYRSLEQNFMGLMKGALEQLRLPSQEFVYSTHVLSMSDDPVLSMAYTNALRSAVVPTLKLDGQFTAIKRLYLDAKVLVHELNALHLDRGRGTASTKVLKGRRRQHLRKRRHKTPTKTSNKKRKTSRTMGKKTRRKSAISRKARKWGRTTRNIPIFLFSLDFPLPVFIDKYYQSRAVDGVVVAVQSAQHLWESHLACNNKAIYWNLRDPIRSIVSSTASVLGGSLPAHMSYSHAHNRTQQNWMWAVGNSPTVEVSAGLFFSKTQADNIHRNYVVNGIREATSTVNAAIERLQNQPTTIGNEVLKLLRASSSTERKSIERDIHQERRLVPTLQLVRMAHRRLRLLLAELWSDVEALDFAEATSKLGALHKLAHRFETLARVIRKDASRFQCAVAPEEEQLDDNSLLITGIICVGIVIVRLLAGMWSIAKPKIN